MPTGCCPPQKWSDRGDRPCGAGLECGYTQRAANDPWQDFLAILAMLLYVGVLLDQPAGGGANIGAGLLVIQALISAGLLAGALIRAKPKGAWPFRFAADSSGIAESGLYSFALIKRSHTAPRS